MIHELASVHPNAKIGKDVTIGPFTYIEADVIIGDGTWIGPQVTIFDGARIGNECQIFPTAVISAVSQDLKYKGEYTTVEIGNNTIIREGVTIHRGTVDQMKTSIGKNCLIMIYVHIAHDCIIGDNVIIAGYTGLSGHIRIDDYAILEGKVAAQQFVHIGAHTFVGGTSKIRKDIPPYIKVAKDPLQYIGVNSVGLKRRGYSEEKIRTIEKIYKVLFIQNKNISNGIEIIKNEIPECEERKIILDFIAGSPNGMIKGFSQT